MCNSSFLGFTYSTNGHLPNPLLPSILCLTMPFPHPCLSLSGRSTVCLSGVPICVTDSNLGSQIIFPDDQTFQWQTLDSDHNDFSWAAEYASSFADALSAGANYDRLAEDCSLLAGWLAMAEVPLSPTSERGDADDSQFGKKGASMVCFDPKKVPEDQGDCDNDVRAQRFRCTVFPGITREEMGKAIRTRREEGCLPQELLLPNKEPTIAQLEAWNAKPMPEITRFAVVPKEALDKPQDTLC